MTKGTGNHCPICNQDNNCGRVAGCPDGACWCSKQFFPREIFETLPLDQVGKSCICLDCLAKFKHNAKQL
ncbi:cysteine-rich CWC family protein [Paenibacillus sp. sptzw28]|nr:cysteine-rich CWC family protein [Paenibacillus sp. sptzw28]